MTSTVNGISSDEEVGQEEEITLRIEKRGVKREGRIIRPGTLT